MVEIVECDMRVMEMVERAVCGYFKADVVRVVGRVKSGHIQLTQGEALVYRDNVKAGLRLRQAAPQAAGHGAGGKDREVIIFRQHFQAGNMIGVLMGNEHSADFTH